jgi:hypothetical protein
VNTPSALKEERPALNTDPEVWITNEALFTADIVRSGYISIN